jgi:hypothetical protein
MSNVFFFRLHNLQRREEQRVREQQTKTVQRRGKSNRFQWAHLKSCNQLTLAPGRLFEKAPPTPTDSLDEVEMQIPRYVQFNLTCYTMF